MPWQSWIPTPQMNPIDYYSTNERVITTLTEFKKCATAAEAHASANNQTVFWRGQMDHEWPLTSSLVRKLAAVTVPDDALLDSVEDKILNEASAWIEDLKDPKYNKPLAKLVYLQHHGIPTRPCNVSSVKVSKAEFGGGVWLVV
jgi:hypothetical protein